MSGNSLRHRCVGLFSPGCLIASLALGTEAAVPTPVSVAATIVDYFSGQPVPSVRVRFKCYGPEAQFDGATDGAGRVAFEGVAAESCRLAWEQGSSYTDVDSYTPAADLGTIRIRWTRWVESALAGLCDKTAAATARPAVDVVVFEPRDKSWRLDAFEQLDAEKRWKHPWKAVLCIDKDYKVVGHYKDASGGSVGEANKTTIKAKVVRLDSGKEYKGKFSSQPPREISVQRGRYYNQGFGDASENFWKWIETLPGN